MEQDITVNVGDEYVLNCRAVGFIIHNNKILFHHNPKEVYYAILGGRVHIGEDSKTAVIREFEEELGKKVKIVKGITTIENFFKHKGKEYHEIAFLYQLEFVNEEDKKIEDTMYCIEKDGEHIQYEWIDIDKIDEYDIRPKIVKKLVKSTEYEAHIINKDTSCPNCGGILMHLMPGGNHLKCIKCGKYYLSDNGKVGKETTSPYRNKNVLY